MSRSVAPGWYVSPLRGSLPSNAGAAPRGCPRDGAGKTDADGRRADQATKKTAAPFRGRRLSWKANGMIQLRAVAMPAGGASPV